MVLGAEIFPFCNFVLFTVIVLFLKSTSAGVSANTSPILRPVCNWIIAIFLTLLFLILAKTLGISSLSKYFIYSK